MQRITRAAFVVALKEGVSGSFPFQADETFEDWVARAREIPNPSRRAMLAARMSVLKQRLIAQYSARKSAWIASARLTFQPGPRKACYVCGGFGPITQAHHVIPLNEQFDLVSLRPIMSTNGSARTTTSSCISRSIAAARIRHWGAEQPRA